MKLTTGQSKSISIHALREEGDRDIGLRDQQRHAISIHALREEGDVMAEKMGRPLSEFLSTPSARRATQFSNLGVHLVGISIHALREEGDSA
mgnify:CR=1 FL=1